MRRCAIVDLNRDVLLTLFSSEGRRDRLEGDDFSSLHSVSRRSLFLCCGQSITDDWTAIAAQKRGSCGISEIEYGFSL